MNISLFPLALFFCFFCIAFTFTSNLLIQYLHLELPTTTFNNGSKTNSFDSDLITTSPIIQE